MFIDATGRGAKHFQIFYPLLPNNTSVDIAELIYFLLVYTTKNVVAS